MEKMYSSVIFLTLQLFLMCQAIKLRCRFCNYGISAGTDFEETCDLLIKEEITPDMENHRFEFVGLTGDQKSQVKTLIFRNSTVAFVPKEAFSFFPNLERITMLNTSLGTLEYDWLKMFLKFAKHIKFLDFRWNKINYTDPRTLEIFSRFERVNLRWNLCVDKRFEIFSGDVSRMRLEMDNCFKHYYIDGGFYVAGLKSLKIERKIDRAIADIQELKTQIAELKKAVDKMTKTC